MAKGRSIFYKERDWDDFHFYHGSKLNEVKVIQPSVYYEQRGSISTIYHSDYYYKLNLKYPNYDWNWKIITEADFFGIDFVLENPDFDYDWPSVCWSPGIFMKDISEHTQLIAITHLPQIAAMGNSHIKVYKSSDDHTTRTYVKQLEGEDRVVEIAQMIDGNQITQTARTYAEKLLN